MTNIGYACQVLGIPFCQQKTIQLKYLNDTKLLSVIENNLDVLERIIDYNFANNIFLFRVSSDLIPFGSSLYNKLDWQKIFEANFDRISQKIKDYNIRISMHPGQYTVLNSPREKVLENSILDLEYHNRVLKNLHNSKQNKITLHIGGVYGDKKSAIKRFINSYNLLADDIKEKLIIENDEKFYNIEDILEISTKINIPAVLDIFHHTLNPPSTNQNINYWLKQCKNTFKSQDGRQKIHFSQQFEGKKIGSHSLTINGKNFLEFYNGITDKNLDIMLEVKDKNLSATKCINLISNKKSIKSLEDEWAKYKYKILEKNHNDYLSIRALLKDKFSYPAIEFYEIIDRSLKKTENKSDIINAALHVWGYFKEKTSSKQKETFFNKLKKFEKGLTSINPVKKLLWEYALLYKDKYLLKSYYFYL